MLKTSKAPRFHPAGESEDEDYDAFGFDDTRPKKKCVYPHDSTIDYESQFHKEIAAGNLKGVQDSFNNGALLKVIDKIHCGGNNGLMTACCLGHWDIVAYLLEVGADPNFSNAELVTPLMAVCCSVYAKDDKLSRCARILLEKGANLNAVDSLATTPLMNACKFGHVGVVSELLKKGPNINMTDRKGWTALIWAVNKGIVETVVMLLKAGAKKKIKDNDKKTAYSLALSKKGTERMLAILNPKKHGKKALAAKRANDFDDNGLADWMSRLTLFVPSNTTPKYKGMKLNLFEFLTATDDELITLGMKYSWQRKQTLMFIKHYHLQSWTKFKTYKKGSSRNDGKKRFLTPEETPVLTFTAAANQVLALQNRLVIIQATSVFLQRQCEGEDMQDDAKMVQLARMCSFGLNDVVKELQNILISLERTDKTLVYPADYIKPLAENECKLKSLSLLSISAVACLGAFVFWKVVFISVPAN